MIVNINTIKDIKKKLPAEPNNERTLWNTPSIEFLAIMMIFSLSGIILLMVSGRESFIPLDRFSMLVAKSSLCSFRVNDFICDPMFEIKLPMNATPRVRTLANIIKTPNDLDLV